MNDLPAFARLVDALRPWLDHLVIVGGWAHRLLRFHPLANPPAHLPIMTRDADVAVSRTMPLAGDIGAALRAANFHEEFLGEHTPPVSRYWLGAEDQSFFAEFVAPLAGSGVKRTGAPDVTLSKAGITAQKLRYTNLLLMSPWTVALGHAVGVPVEPNVEVMIANPVSFIAQKLLIRQYREPAKQAQDVLYVHDTLELFGGELEALREAWRTMLRPGLGESTGRKVERLCGEQFGAVTDVIRSAARIPLDRSLRPDRLRQACAYGLEQVFGPGTSGGR